MNPGKLDKRIYFVTYKKEKDADGYPINKENIFKKSWAEVRGLRGREFYAAATTESEKNKVFKCRYFKGLEPSLKIKYNNTLYDITSINDLYEKHIEYEIHAKEVGKSG